MLHNNALEHAQVERILQPMDTATLDQLDEVTLLNRVDSKYVFHINYLPTLIEELQPHYRVLKIENKKLFRYDSLYFDTPDYLLYRFHHNGRPDRLKVRYRTYVDSDLTYFEVKYKLKGLRTAKKRIKTPCVNHTLGNAEFELISHKYLNNNLLEEKLWTKFDRITLVGKNFAERATIDLNISFDNYKTVKSFPQLIIAEVKQEKSCVFSPIIQAFKKRHFDMAGFSKYCAGIAMTENIKHNAFKPKLIKINKILNGNT